MGRAVNTLQMSQASSSVALPLFCTYLFSVCALTISLQSTEHQRMLISIKGVFSTLQVIWGSSKREAIASKFSQNSISLLEQRSERCQGQEGQASSGSIKVLTPVLISESLVYCFEKRSYLCYYLVEIRTILLIREQHPESISK